MTELRAIYKCNICGHVIEIFNEGAETLKCCNQPMVKLEEQTAEASTEKHVPVIEETMDGIIVKIGSIEHPMEDKHYIKFIEVQTKDMILKAELKPGMKPQATFPVNISDVVKVREYCNVHGLWKYEP